MNSLSPRPVDAVITAARALLGERLSTNDAIRQQHSRGEDTTTPTLPDAVAFVETNAEVSELLKLCHQNGVPVTPFGAGTSLEGHVNPVRAGTALADVQQYAALKDGKDVPAARAVVTASAGAYVDGFRLAMLAFGSASVIGAVAVALLSRAGRRREPARDGPAA